MSRHRAHEGVSPGSDRAGGGAPALSAKGHNGRAGDREGAVAGEFHSVARGQSAGTVAKTALAVAAVLVFFVLVLSLTALVAFWLGG